ncbi:MAG: Hsp20 family protein [Alphaproteobacteria bacterium]|nr:Hsp20 family protein [Alphaproteobacteria bacterium]
MQTFDFSPFYRSTVGFDRLFDVLDGLTTKDTAGYPPYNIERTGEDAFRITLAVAGFGSGDIAIESRQNTLLIKGAKAEVKDADEREFLHRAIAERAFERRFQLADYVEVAGAELTNGLLHIDLERKLPENQRSRQIEIKTGSKDAKGRLLDKSTN